MCFFVNNDTEMQTIAGDGSEKQWKGLKKVMCLSQTMFIGGGSGYWVLCCSGDDKFGDSLTKV